MPTKTPSQRHAEYVARVTRGEGFMPWQKPGLSAKEDAFRVAMEARKDEMLRQRARVRRPALVTEAQLARLRRNIRSADWAKAWYAEIKEVADYIVRQPAGYVEQMIEELSATNGYAWNCPNCVGLKSQEGGGTLYKGTWDYRQPDVVSCKFCGHSYPSADYPETAILECPRTGQTFTFYRNEAERAHPEDRSGKHAWHWAGRPVHVSFTGTIRSNKVRFMILALPQLALVYRVTGKARYAEAVASIMARLAQCYRYWLYHDYWDTMADCDPLFAAWHDGRFRKGMKLEFKRHLCADAFAEDTSRSAVMLQGFWGAGRVWPSAEMIRDLIPMCLAYDLTYSARNASGKPVWSRAARRQVERELLLEYVMGAEPFVGGNDAATNGNNKAPSVYVAMATVAKCLGLPQWADVAIRGYELIRDQSFEFDGFSHESPLYTGKYLGEGTVEIPEVLAGFRWPKGFKRRRGTVDLFKSDAKLRLILQTYADQLLPNGRYLPIADTTVGRVAYQQLLEIGARRFPERYSGLLPLLYSSCAPGQYAALHCEPGDLQREAAWDPPEGYFPAWMHALFRHGSGPDSTALSLSFSPWGGHRHYDNLSLYYSDCGRPILGDLGYVCDTPNLAWIHGTFCHNLVVVDDQEQARERTPALLMAATTPKVSVVEAASQVYDQCREYRRLAALIKGPDARTFVIDIFRVKGGKKHAFRLFSEIAASDSASGRLEFSGIGMPAEEPIPDFGGSTEREHIYGLLDPRSNSAPPDAWQATWRERGRAYRLHLLSAADSVIASHGPGMEDFDQAGRRARFVEAVRQGRDVESTFVAIHEPSGPRGRMPIRRATRLDLPDGAGPDAVALRIESSWGVYYVLSEFANETAVDGVRFQGRFGVICTPPTGDAWYMGLGAATLARGDLGFSDAPAAWSGNAKANTATVITTSTKRPADWPALPPDCTNHVIVSGGQFQTGFPVGSVGCNRIGVTRFPLQEVSEFELPALACGPGANE